MRFLLTCLALLAAAPANALSCLRPDAVRLFEQARDAEETYYIVKGRISLLEEANLPTDPKVPTRTRARIEGSALAAETFGAPFSREVALETTCASIWCGQLDGLAGELIMAIETEGDALSLRIGPCGGDQVPWDQNGEDRLLACYRDGDCGAKF